jgi:signal transduction histidine kinase
VADLPRLARSGPDTSGPRVEVKVDGALGDVGPAVGAALYRIAQESVANAVRHARRATSVVVEVERVDGTVRLTVTDDGEGGPAGDGRGFGLLGMAERAERLGGRFHAGPARGRGWRVEAELPLIDRQQNPVSGAWRPAPSCRSGEATA